jgi:hypothetical protein
LKNGLIVVEGEEVDEESGEIDWDRLEQIGLGRMGLGCDELYDLTPRTFNNQLIGFNAYQEQLMQDRWEQTRMIVHSTIVPHSKKKLKPKEVLSFPWDNDEKAKKKKQDALPSKEYIQSVLKRYDNN